LIVKRADRAARQVIDGGPCLRASAAGGSSRDRLEACAEDLDALHGHIPETSLWITRLTAELSRPALAADLQLQASPDQTSIYGYYRLEKAIGVPPPCPIFPPRSPREVYHGGCAITAGQGMPTLGSLALLGALTLARRRQGRRR
jgi:hypothetical protein